ARGPARGLGIAPARGGILGSWGGGHLALLPAIRPGAPDRAPTPIVAADGSTDTAVGDDSVAFVLALYPPADPLARYRYVLSREHEPPPPSGLNAHGLLA